MMHINDCEADIVGLHADPLDRVCLIDEGGRGNNSAEVCFGNYPAVVGFGNNLPVTDLGIAHMRQELVRVLFWNEPVVSGGSLLEVYGLYLHDAAAVVYVLLVIYAYLFVWLVI